MIVVFLLFLFVQIGESNLKTTNFNFNCSFSSLIYSSNAAVIAQFQFNNPKSIVLSATYAFSSSNIFQLGLIYQFPYSNLLVPFPIIFNCSTYVRSCQVKKVQGTKISSRESEPIHVDLTLFNYTTTTSVQFQQMGLYLQQGQYQLSNCSLDSGQQVTDPQTIFQIDIQYEKPLGAVCNSINDPCGPSSLIACASSKCNCVTPLNSIVSYSNLSYCADLVTLSNCNIFPSRCTTWCNETDNILCVCPSDTLKIKRNNSYVCELPVDSNNCSIGNNIHRCPLGQCCINNQCTSCSTLLATSKPDSSNSSISENIRIALGVVAGLLGTSLIILLIVCIWLRRRNRKTRRDAEKALSPSSSLSSTNSSTSSLYITPIQQPNPIATLTSANYQIKDSDLNKKNYRTDSFRQAILSGHNRTQMIERVSTKRDSLTLEDNNHPWSTETFVSLDSIIPVEPNEDQLVHVDKFNNHTYQIINSSIASLTHRV